MRSVLPRDSFERVWATATERAVIFDPKIVAVGKKAGTGG